MNASPFPGMDPYLEASGLWADVHTRLMTIIAEQLTPILSPKYTAELETEIIIDQILPRDEENYPRGYLPDVSVIEQPHMALPAGVMVEAPPAPMELILRMDDIRLVSVQIRHREWNEVVTAIELLSPINKRRGKHRQNYLNKRADYLAADIKLVELDLLRKHPRMPFETVVPPCAYLIASQKSRERFRAWPLPLSSRLPLIPIPLFPPDRPVTLDLQAALDTAYQRARYDLRIDYRRLPDPPLSEIEAAWIQQLLALEPESERAAED